MPQVSRKPVRVPDTKFIPSRAEIKRNSEEKRPIRLDNFVILIKCKNDIFVHFSGFCTCISQNLLSYKALLEIKSQFHKYHSKIICC